ncbi:MAG: SpoIIIAH-like family protein [Clostridia bacterium]|nr:SpoIIIAH-like family protein [Clostridia bacterium]
MKSLSRFRLTPKGIIALAVLAGLLVGAILLNVSLNAKQQSASAGDGPGGGAGGGENAVGDAQDKAVSAGVYTNYFADFRDERSAVRAQEIDYLRMIINEESTDPETLRNAQQRLIDLVEGMEREFSIESMIRSKGFLDAAVTFRNDAVSVVISGESLTEEEVARILDIVKTETGAPASKIRISLNGQSL